MILQDGPPDPGSYKDGLDDLRYQMEKNSTIWSATARSLWWESNQ